MFQKKRQLTTKMDRTRDVPHGGSYCTQCTRQQIGALLLEKFTYLYSSKFYILLYSLRTDPGRDCWRNFEIRADSILSMYMLFVCVFNNHVRVLNQQNISELEIIITFSITLPLLTTTTFDIYDIVQILTHQYLYHIVRGNFHGFFFVGEAQSIGWFI